MTATVTDSLPPDNEDQPQRKLSVAHDPLKRFRGGRVTSPAQMEERINTAYMMMLSGGSRRENVLQLAQKYNVSQRQAEDYYTAAQKLMKTDFAGKREELLNQVNNMRMHTVRKALKRGNYQVVAHLLDSIARGAGEGSIEQEANQAPTLNITIDDKRHSSPPESHS